MVHDRTGDELGEKGNEKRVVEKPVRRNVVLRGIREKRYLLEGEKRNRQGKNDQNRWKPRIQDVVRGLEKEIRVFEIAEKAQIEGDAKGQKQACRLLFHLFPVDRQPDHEIRQYRGRKQQDVSRLPPTVENHGHDDEIQLGGVPPSFQGEMKPNYDDRKENEE